MIKKTIIFTLFLLIGWSIFIKVNPFSLQVNQWQGNIVTAERFIYDSKDVENVLIGTSLTVRLIMDSLPEYTNLSLNGQTIFDGLNVLRCKDDLPKNVFIEINVLQKNENPNFRQIITSPITRNLKEYFPFFRSDRQPLAYVSDEFVKPIVSSFYWKIYLKLQVRLQGNNSQKEFSSAQIQEEAKLKVFNDMLDKKINEYSASIDTVFMNDQFNKLKDHINYLESNGVNVVFYEMPVNPELIELPRAVYFRNKIQLEFPTNDLIYLPQDLSPYRTTDGMHLNPEEAAIYTHYFKVESNKYLK